ncbi:uncharacterized protein HD556DRAFT_1227597 [Suillus plorans]|uniref:Uncharacterized protein n=1 Tax=Suillus plorans TaxID=116603 RepID=A0A9P7DU53_9AGAM|nr:uncharacterized protein HD556DRAFT_1227597 [Suillus plorans]KAG1802900.1 hypothetical protein HD556DRAFT_1227597 [Suillus plorans]
MVESWERGICYSRTALHVSGRVTRSIIVFLVCDLPAARKAAQLAGPTSHFYCTACHCWHRSTCGRTDIQTEDWALKDKNEVRRYAELWKNTGTSVERNKLFASHGVQWSTLWRLSYWDPSRQIVVNTMHCLLEGLAHAHFCRMPSVRICKLGHRTREVMQCIADVIKTTDTPSFLRSVPYNFGETKAGTVKADEWRTLTTVYLPIALVSLWGEGSAHRNSDIAVSRRAILDHTMDLVSAIHIVCLRSMTQDHADAYRTYMINWIRDLQVILPHARHRTNGHMALHVWDYLQLFGPVWSWWCFPYERLIGQLQRLPSNHIFGSIQISLSMIDFLRYAGMQDSKNQLSSGPTSRLQSLNIG